MKKQPKVALVILNWNGREFLERFLPSVISTPYSNIEMVVGDNASSDDSVLFLKNNYPQVRLISNDRNYGFAGGYNRVLEQVEAEYFVLLNSDVEVPTGDWIGPVLKLMESDPLIAAAQPKILSYNDKQLFEYAGAAGGYLDTFGYPFCRGRIFDAVEQDKGQYNKSAEIFWASGAALFIKRSAWTEVGGFDDNFFAHMEEIDLCWRLKQLGYQIWYCPDSVVYHVGGGTLSKESPYKTFLNFRNSLLMIQKNTPAKSAVFKIIIRFILDFLSLIKFLLDRKPENALAVSRAHVDFLKKMRTNARRRASDPLRFNSKGIYPKSIVWAYFVLNKKRYSDL